MLRFSATSAHSHRSLQVTDRSLGRHLRQLFSVNSRDVSVNSLSSHPWFVREGPSSRPTGVVPTVLALVQSALAGADEPSKRGGGGGSGGRQPGDPNSLPVATQPAGVAAADDGGPATMPPSTGQAEQASMASALSTTLLFTQGASARDISSEIVIHSRCCCC